MFGLCRPQVRDKIQQRTAELVAEDPNFMKKTLPVLNSEAVAFFKAGDFVSCLAAYAKLFRKVHQANLVHEDLHVSYANRACAHVRIGMFQEALIDAEKCRELAEVAYKKG
jgi:type III protein arginine methyltransferase